MTDVIEPTTWDGPRVPPFKTARRDEADLLAQLIAALHDQTAAMRELAESNRAVVDLVLTQQAEAEDDQEDTPGPVYLEDALEG